jgi:hypothetical protein
MYHGAPEWELANHRFSPFLQTPLVSSVHGRMPSTPDFPQGLVIVQNNRTSKRGQGRKNKEVLKVTKGKFLIKGKIFFYLLE